MLNNPMCVRLHGRDVRPPKVLIQIRLTWHYSQPSKILIKAVWANELMTCDRSVQAGNASSEVTITSLRTTNRLLLYINTIAVSHQLGRLH